MDYVKMFADAELIKNLRSGIMVNESIQFIYRDYFEGLSWFIKNNSGSQQDAEDIFQEVVVSFIELVQMNKFRGESSIKTFLFSLNRNIWLNELKRRGRTLQREMNYEKAQEKVDVDIRNTIVERETRIQLMQIMDELGDICKKILLMFYYENLSMKEMVTNLEYENEQVVRNKKYKCLKQLEKLIEINPSLKQTLKNSLHG